ncbi:MAG TPA: 16S rRNA (cytosine(1402)-N(4))-methyltransferase RsmH [Candidatus Polarisedimenticolia bacterium]|nr:16S rRNA (cytosine(1402)-N(4))-methyltransferase RsmH [Candidatus Polarisedimenticolia bacterium]
MLSEAAAMTNSIEPPDIPHRPVLLRESLDLLSVPRGGMAIDCTVGGGGHARALLEAVGPSGRVVGLDRDAESLARAAGALRDFEDRFLPIHADYRDLSRIAAERGLGRVDAILADFGFSSLQMDDPGRGFSFSADGPLDMRLDRSQGETAADLLATVDETELTRLLRQYGEEPRAPRLARAILRARSAEPIRTTRQLANIVEKTSPRTSGRIHPATRVFQALRIAVNDELEGLERFIEEACRLLIPGGRAAFIAFHSLEDRKVKQTLVRLVPHCVCPPSLPRCVCGTPGIVDLVNRKAVRPSDAELRANPRARSARLRAARRREEQA